MTRNLLGLASREGKDTDDRAGQQDLSVTAVSGACTTDKHDINHASLFLQQLIGKVVEEVIVNDVWGQPEGSLQVL